MPMTKGEVPIYYETRGQRGGVPLLFIQGFTWQLIGWREEFCKEFVDRGAFLILFDNRDVGLSKKFGGPSDYDGGYNLVDMALDGFSVLDDLGLASAHLVGASMGGMIAQSMALLQPDRVRSLNLIYSAPSIDQRYFVQQSAPDPVKLAMRHEREVALKNFVEGDRASRSTAYDYDERWIQELGSRMYARCYAPEGLLRQGYAISRWATDLQALKQLQMPASIIHGRADGRIQVQASFDLARVLMNSELHIYPGLGHEIPEPLWSEFAAIIMRTASRSRRLRGRVARSRFGC
jgi:pimeloyl-ACP methyl ester carboxylesterase